MPAFPILLFGLSIVSVPEQCTAARIEEVNAYVLICPGEAQVTLADGSILTVVPGKNYGTAGPP